MVESYPTAKSASGLFDKIKSVFNPSADKTRSDFELIKEIITAVRNLRSENKIAPAKLAQAVIISANKSSLIESQREIIKKLARLGDLAIKASGEKPGSSAVSVIGETEIYLDLAGLIDIEAEKARLKKELDEASHYIKSLEIKLANIEFVKNAPEAVVTGLKDKMAQAQEKSDKLQNQLSSL
jgi:valyl-tRNA synthetase